MEKNSPIIQRQSQKTIRTATSNDATDLSSSSAIPTLSLSLLFNLCAFRHDRAKLSDNGSLHLLLRGTPARSTERRAVPKAEGVTRTRTNDELNLFLPFINYHEFIIDVRARTVHTIRVRREREGGLTVKKPLSLVHI